MAGSFEITYPGQPEECPVYIALDDPKDWPDCSIALTIDGTPAPGIQGKRDESPYQVCRLTEQSVVRVEAARDGINLGELQETVRFPATFLEIKRNATPIISRLGKLSEGRGYDPKSILILKIDSPTKVLKGVMARIEKIGAEEETVIEVAAELGGETTIELRPGQYDVSIQMLDGSMSYLTVKILKNEVLEARFATQQSPHDWMAAAAVSGTVADHTRTESPRSHSERAKVEVVGSLSIAMEVRAVVAQKMDIVKGAFDERFARYEVNDGTPSRFIRIPEKVGPRYIPEQISAWVPPCFVRITSSLDSKIRQEYAVIPSLGRDGKHTVGGWTPSLLIDREAGPNEPFATVMVEDRKWQGLLGFLRLRDFLTGAKLLEEGLMQSATAAMEDKVSNPLAAIAGALIAVGVANPETAERWDPWLMNIANWFPDIPDGPIIVARRILSRARSEEQIAEAYRWLIEGFRRGVPVYSLSVDWLARGLESIPGTDEELAGMQKTARRLSLFVDPTRTFTVVRVTS